MSNSNKTTAGQQILDFLKAKGKKNRKAGTATTEELADALNVTIKYAFDRLYWMEKKDGVLTSTGKGKARVWRVTPKARKAKEQAPAADQAAE